MPIEDLYSFKIKGYRIKGGKDAEADRAAIHLFVISTIIAIVIFAIYVVITNIAGILDDTKVESFVVRDNGATMEIDLEYNHEDYETDYIYYTVAIREKSQNIHKFITFMPLSAYDKILNETKTSTSEPFAISLSEKLSHIYIYQGEGKYELVLIKDNKTNEWRKANYWDNMKYRITNAFSFGP